MICLEDTEGTYIFVMTASVRAFANPATFAESVESS